MKNFKELLNEKTVLIKPKRVDDFKMEMDDDGVIEIYFGGTMGWKKTGDIYEAIAEVEEFTKRRLKDLAHDTKHMQMVQKKIAKIKKEVSGS